jgi:hypothetical protein
MDIAPSIQLKKRIMRRVYAIWLFRKLPWLAGELAVVMLIASQAAGQIFVNRVLQNAVEHSFTRSPASLFSYFFKAFFNTDFLVQILLISFVILGALAIRDLMRTTQPFLHRSRLQHASL